MIVTGIDTNFSRLFVNRENFVGAAITHQSSIDNVILKPDKFLFPVGTSTISQFTFENYTTYFNPLETVGVGSTGTHYTITLHWFRNTADSDCRKSFCTTTKNIS